MSKLDRVKKLDSSKTTVQETNVKIAGFADLVKELQAATLANQQSHAELIKSMKQLSQVLVMSQDNEMIDLTGVEKALANLQTKMGEKKENHIDVLIDFDRDKYGLMKSGIRMHSNKPKLNS